MSDQLFERAVRDWLEEGSDRTPPNAIEAVLLAVKTTRQVRGLRIPRRLPNMPVFSRALSAAAVALVVVVGAGGAILLSSNSPGSGGRTPTPSPASSVASTPNSAPVVSPTDAAVVTGPLAPGGYHLNGVGGGVPMTVAVPSGWSGFEDFAVNKDYGTAESDAGAGFGVWEITNRFVDPCSDHTLVSPAPGPEIDELLSALAAQPGVKAGKINHVTIDGYPASYVELTVVTDIATCGYQGFWLWASPGDHRYVQGTGEVDRIYAVEVDGARHTFFARIPARTTTADRAELEAIIASIDIKP